MKKYLYIFATLMLTGCMGILDQYPKSGPSNETFFSNETELTLGVNAVYKTLYWFSSESTLIQFQPMLDGLTENYYIRGTYGGNLNVVQSGQANGETSLFASAWKHFYAAIAQANNLLDHMDRAKDVVTEEFYDRIRAEALVIRAYQYHYLVFLYGDVPFADHFLEWNEADLPKTKAETIIARMEEDLQWASEHLPDTWTGEDAGRVTSGFALGLKARYALYAGDYETAAAAAKAVMDKKVYTLYPQYGDLFLHVGKDASEIMMNIRYLNTIQIHHNPKYIGTRLSDCYSIIVPTWTLIDTYQCTDGKRIDQSPLYDAKHPFENRDPRLRASILVPGDYHNGYKFEPCPDSTTTTLIVGDKVTRVPNTDATHAYRSPTGFVSRKYCDEIDCPENVKKSELPVIVMRYPEILLTYAEAQLERGIVDQSVVDAINAVRCRESVGMPAVSVSDGVDKIREILRYERNVEFQIKILSLKI